MDKIDLRTNPNLIIVLGEYIRSKRVEKGIGLREMAEHLSISPAYLSNLESGKHPMINPLLLKKISRKLNIDHLKLFKMIGYTDKDTEELKKEITSELLDEIDDVEIGKILGKLMEMSPDELQLVKQYIEFISKK
ncbi:anaerobic benzoate catabolism transcriptional regulator [Sebaldella termitidis]|jgi:transcriptional regulator with XRE-family HTH domain|uniref:Transcriptional regulator, XRE family n=1 Tax=Sebaldella termitidis (strain ATCC 33386 / NCTC 11300) TaxID=526218 RepID=D1AJX6_SEBTE|nr:helix-turn-helix domain-containing protein [Sebaldella termitidis]ACZ07033.1 transcriptional regulator, XRE family [Sebaldella termitidis ATCC 33386]SUI22323.1 anaerobic benzoate catabolism transcriptional regulator [Sebaldella termitidis]